MLTLSLFQSALYGKGQETLYGVWLNLFICIKDQVIDLAVPLLCASFSGSVLNDEIPLVIRPFHPQFCSQFWSGFWNGKASKFDLWLAITANSVLLTYAFCNRLAVFKDSQFWTEKANERLPCSKPVLEVKLLRKERRHASARAHIFE